MLFDPDAPQDPCNPLLSLSIFQDIVAQFDNEPTVENANGSTAEDTRSERAGDLSNRTDCCTEESYDLNETAVGSLDHTSTSFMAFNPAYNNPAAADQTLLISDCNRTSGGDVSSSGDSSSWVDERSTSDEALIALLAGCAKGADAAPASPPRCSATPAARLYWLPAPAFAPQPFASMFPPLPAQSDADIALALASCSAATRSELGGDDGSCWLHVPAMP